MDSERDEREFCSVFRSHVDSGVWLCNVPYVDVIVGLQASTSLRKLKAYVEEVADRDMDYGKGRWVKVDSGWSYYPEAV